MGKSSAQTASALLQVHPLSGKRIIGWTIGGILVSATNALCAILDAPANDGIHEFDPLREPVDGNDWVLVLDGMYFGVLSTSRTLVPRKDLI